MTDREMLGLAAKAAGINLHFSAMDDVSPREGETFSTWNPLTDDGDAFRLLANLHLDITQWDDEFTVSLPDGYVEGAVTGDRSADLRRAIVCAAAEIERGKQ